MFTTIESTEFAATTRTNETLRKIGVEIETAYTSPDWRTILGCSDSAGWEHHHDGSVNGDEFVTEGPIDSFEPIDRFLPLLRNCRVNRTCGLHVHIDMSGYSEFELRNIAESYYRTQDAWFYLVAPSRRTNSYCRKFSEDYDYTDFRYIPCRYYWANWKAYDEHGSLEIRLHQGTLSAKKIKNWAELHTRFIVRVANNPVSRIMSADHQFDTIANLCGGWNSSLVQWWRNRAETLGKIFLPQRAEFAA